MEPIQLFDILQIPESDLKNYTVRLNKSLGGYIDVMAAYEMHRDRLERHISQIKWGEDKRRGIINTPRVLQFIQLDSHDSSRWLFVGAYEVGSRYQVGVDEFQTQTKVPEFEKYDGRLITRFTKARGRIGFDPYNLSNPSQMSAIRSGMVVERIVESPASVNPFPGYEQVRLTHNQLQAAVQNAAWAAALGSIQAVYLQTDLRNGWHYVGSAYSHSRAERGLLSRWTEYSNGDFSGGNKNLKDLGAEYIHSNFQYSILEIFDMRVKASEIIRREHWWMDTLDSVRHHDDSVLPHGYNTVREREMEESED